MDEVMENIDVRDHIKVRYCERIIGLERVIGKDQLAITNSIVNPKTRKTEIDAGIRAYINVNDERITNDIRAMFTHSDFIYRGTFGGDNVVKNFYLRDDIIIVSEAQRPRLITLYRVDFGFGEKNRELVQWLKDSIVALRDQAEGTAANVEEFVTRKKVENLTYDDEIRNFESRLDALRKLKKSNTEVIEAEQSRLILVNKELESKVHQLCNNPDYKRDMMEGA